LIYRNSFVGTARSFTIEPSQCGFIGSERPGDGGCAEAIGPDYWAVRASPCCHGDYHAARSHCGRSRLGQARHCRDLARTARDVESARALL